ncbi:hypothetical protein ACF1AJ_19205 [Leifsonia sp. NPDC014704]|uniref:Uncharacterized protein n=1 Tax=Leifsonia virtsii TaxID=3035915 RepID=A0ABT8J2T0_9MICO|nr:hypothetical protein [Leifsonia virtsii]MDN4599388.1 hypothetical protein [Leifsonia virtsii]
MIRYTPTEILQAGIDQTRETFADLYVAVDRVRKAIDFHWHRVNVDPDVQPIDGEERLREHGAGAGFGNEIALPTPYVDLSRLTDAGLALFAIGAHTAFLERDELIAEHERLAEQLDWARNLPTNEEWRRYVATLIRNHDAYLHRQQPLTATPVAPSAWPVRVPGTDTILPAVSHHPLTAAA